MARAFGGDDLVKQIKDSLDIVDVISNYIELIPRGSGFTALCPFHAEKTPSFSVNRNGQFYHCFGCKKSGDVISFVMAIEGMEFLEALRMLGEKCGVVVERYDKKSSEKIAGQKLRIYKILESAAKIFENWLKSDLGAKATRYLTQRRIPAETSAEFRLGFSSEAWTGLKDQLVQAGYSEQEIVDSGLAKRSDNGRVYDLFRNRLMMPIFDIQGRVLGFGGRVLDDSLPKYINSPESRVFHKSQLFYGIHRARRAINASKCAVIMEGYTDVILAHCRGVKNALAALGTALTDDHARMLSRMAEKIVLFFDGDEAGVNAAIRGIQVLLRHDLEISIVTLDQGDPYDFFLENGAEQFWAFEKSRKQDFFEFLLNRFEGQYDLKSPTGKTQAARAMLKFVDCCKDTIKKALLLKKISDALGAPEKILRQEYVAQGPKNPSLKQTNQMAPQDRTITSLEDDLILGLIKSPDLIKTYYDEIQAFRSRDEIANAVIKGILDLHLKNRMEIKELTFLLQENPAALERVITLYSKTIKTDPKLLVQCAINTLRQKNYRKEYNRIREQGRAILKDGESEEVDQYLKELTRKLRKQKGPKKKEDGA